MEVVGVGLGIDLCDRTFLRPNDAREIAEMVDRERNIGCRGFADRLAIVDGFSGREQRKVGFHAIGDPVEDQRTLGQRSLAPALLCSMRRVQRQLDVFCGGAGHFAKGLADDRADVLKIIAARGVPRICRR
jgi:hypothetical protein